DLCVEKDCLRFIASTLIASTKLLIQQLANLLEPSFGFAAEYLKFVRKGRPDFSIFQIRYINSDVHSRSIDTSAHRKKTDTDIGNRSRITFARHFAQKVVGLRRCLHNP